MNERIQELAELACVNVHGEGFNTRIEKFAESIVKECVKRETMLGAIARGWCSEKNRHKTLDSDLALAIFDEVEKQIKEHFGVEE